MKKEINPIIDFADASYDSCEMIKETLIVYLNSWDEKKIKIYFHNPILFTYRTGSIVSGAFEKTDPSPLLNEVLSRYYEKIPTAHPFKLFILEDIEDFIFFEIIAENSYAVKEHCT